MKPTSEYSVVQQAEDIDEALVIVDVVQPLEERAQEQATRRWNKAKWAGCVGATTGCLTMGFVPALVCGTGCIYAAKQEGPVGDLARACGSYAIRANVMAREMDEQHHVIENTNKVLTSCWEKAKDLNQEHQIVSKTKNCVVSGVRAGVAITRENKLVERTARGVGTVVSTVAKELTSSSSDDSLGHTEPEIIVTDTAAAEAHEEQLTV